MAEKKGSGFKTFLLIFFTIILAAFLGCAGFLILSPNSNIFGIQYRANIKTETIQYVKSQTQLLKFKDYTQINIDVSSGNGHTAVNINCGSPNENMSASTITFNQSSSGYQYVGASEKYTISATESGSTLNIVVTEPSYNFVQLLNNTSLNLNVFSSTDNLNNANINIKTGSGMVKIGGQIMSSSPAKAIQLVSLDVTTTSGKIQLTDTATVSNTATLTSKTGAINISGNKTFSKLNLSTETGKINTAEIVGNVSIKSYNSVVTMGNITGNVDVDMESGILNLQNVTGNLVSDHKILYTTVNAGTIKGETILINDQGNFTVNIKRTEGVTSIETGNKNVTINEVVGTCSVITYNGSIYITKVASNSSEMTLNAKGRGNVFVNFENVLGDNKITTNTGRILMKFGSDSVYNLNASSENNKVYLAWLDVYEKSILLPDPPDSSCGNLVTLKSVSGGIRVDFA